MNNQENNTKSGVGKGLLVGLAVFLVGLVLMFGVRIGRDFAASKKSAAENSKVEDLDEAAGSENGDDSEISNTAAGSENGDNAEISNTAAGDLPAALSRTSFLGKIEIAESSVTPSVPSYKANADFSNVLYVDRKYLSDDAKAKLLKNLFVVGEWESSEFFYTYEDNRYDMFPSFVTVDSLMHSYHLYFAALLKSTEKNYLSKELQNLSLQMLESSKAQYDALKGTDWEEAAKLNVGFFTVGCLLQNADTEIPEYVKDEVSAEMKLIMAATGQTPSPLFGGETPEDYSQYIPRGYYEGDVDMENYFRAMMWYGRRAFFTDNEVMNQSSILMTKILENETRDEWNAIYTVTSFFCGASDDLGYYEILPLIDECFGEGATIETIAKDDNGFDAYCRKIKKLDPPQINSIIIDDGENNVIPSYRFMGQRFTVDGAVMQKLIYSDVKENAAGDRRMLPDVLDVAATLGSDTAYEILKAQGDTEFKNYSENLSMLQEKYGEAPNSLWNESIYAGWLNTLRPLLEEKGEGYPSFMTNGEWAKKTLETFAGSYTELKHDTILYSKQPVAENGGGDLPEYDDRGYVEPEPVVYARFYNLANGTMNGLESYGMLSEQAKSDLQVLAQLAQSFREISEKELQNETLTDEEYELIRNYGGNLEHFWHNAAGILTGDENILVQDFSCPLVADIATDPNGQVLEVANGGARTIYVIVPVDGTLRLASGTVYSFYQFPWNINDRLTDKKWKQMIGFEMTDNGEYNFENQYVLKPEWTKSYIATRENW